MPASAPGAIGNILSLLGYNNLTGLDMSEGMLAQGAGAGVLH
jgi:hypothetical protein